MIDGGRTSHFRFGLPVPLVNGSQSKIIGQSESAKLLKHAKLIVWDEASMAPRYAYEAVNNLLKDLMKHIDIKNKDIPFGGKVVLLTGDFRQTLPVVKRGSQVEIVQTSIKKSSLWREFKQYALNINMRANNNETEFKEWLLKLGNGNLETIDTNEQIIKLPNNVVLDENSSLINFVFGDNIDINDRTIYNKAILCPKNEDAFQLNQEVLNIMPGEEKTYTSADSVICEDPEEQENIPIEFINSQTPSGFPLHIIKLKIGSVVMLLRNINTTKGLCNGTRLIIKQMSDRILDVEIIDGSNAGYRTFLPRFVLKQNEYDMAIKIQRIQFPIRLSYAMTINKSQGQTFEKIGILLKEPVFSHGQLYVAFSRVRSFEDVKCKITNSVEQGSIPGKDGIYTKNIIYKSIFN